MSDRGIGLEGTSLHFAQNSNSAALGARRIVGFAGPCLCKAASEFSSLVSKICNATLLKPTTILKLITLLALIALVRPATALQIKRVETNSGTVLRLRGDVRNGDYGRLKSVLQNGSVIGLEITSFGGSLEDGFDIARVVRDRGLVVYASKECELRVRLHLPGREREIHWPRLQDRRTFRFQRSREGRCRQRSRYYPDVAASGRTRSAAFCHRQNRRDASSQDHLSGQSRSGQAECASSQSVLEEL